MIRQIPGVAGFSLVGFTESDLLGLLLICGWVLIVTWLISKR